MGKISHTVTCCACFQPRGPAGWQGDPNNQTQWNPGMGKPTPKMANQNPAQYGGVDDLNWNLPKVSASILSVMSFSTGC